MKIHLLTAISPIDGRYRIKTDSLALFFSEYALIKYRLLVEIEYFIALCEYPLEQLKEIDTNVFDKLRKIYINFSIEEAEQIKEIENTTNHDVKAVEYYLKKKFEEINLQQYKEFIHFGLTSQDINNTAIPYSLRDAVHHVYYPLLDELISKLEKLVVEWENIPMLAKTHGQPASPTRLGKEIKVYVERLNTQLNLLKNIPCSAKFGGATGNFNAHKVAYPTIDWEKFGNKFVNKILKLEREKCTTQISNYDNFAAIFDNFKRINTILIDFSRDLWQYISNDYFKQKIINNEIGSSAMPHKVNPIDFENAEGNLGIGNAIFEYLSAKLPISRLQRDLTDSTVLRNIGTPIAHSVIAIRSLLKGIDKLIMNPHAINKDLEENWSVVSEAIQTILRRENYPNPYEALKELTRKNNKIDENSIKNFINKLKISTELKKELMAITPFNYTGV